MSGCGEPIPGRGVIHWEIGTRDAARMRAFYADLFGRELEDTGPGYTLVVPRGGVVVGGGGFLAPLTSRSRQA